MIKKCLRIERDIMTEPTTNDKNDLLVILIEKRVHIFFSWKKEYIWVQFFFENYFFYGSSCLDTVNTIDESEGRRTTGFLDSKNGKWYNHLILIKQDEWPLLPHVLVPDTTFGLWITRSRVTATAIFFENVTFYENNYVQLYKWRMLWHPWVLFTQLPLFAGRLMFSDKQ